ncbi:MAG: cytochrome-c oxidase, cbb3-type subunit I [Planctomycetota bacterium]|nr:MAG: cytochrome-c oxidase, cbb3-type subunit I [Planctomycetota bacterium]
MASAPHAERNDTPPAGGAQLESFTYDDKIVRAFMMATFIWGFVGMLVGVFIALQMALPALNFGLPFTSFGRLRPLHTNAVIFAFAGNAIFTAIYYSTQRLCKTRMYSDFLSWAHFWGWQLIIVSAALTLPFGITQAKEYAELEWPIDLAIAVVWLGFFGGNFFMTLARRRERHIYVAIWFYIATIVTVTMLHVFNNLWIPIGIYEWLKTGSVSSIDNLMKSYPIYAGVQDAFMQWWYGHNAVAFFLTTPFLGLMYYFLPKAADRPVFSYRLSIVHFWSLVFIYIWAGPHHLHYSAVAGWASTLGMIFSVMLWMPSWGGMINGLLTLRGAWHRVAIDPVLKFFVVGVTFYGMSTFEGPLLSVKSVNALSHFTDWTIAHVHGGTLGWNGFMTFGMVYWLLPRVFQTKLYSEKLATTHFWVSTFGILLYVIPIYIAGITQGLMWRAFDASGQLAYPDFVETVQRLIPFYWLRAAGGTLYLFGLVLLAVNIVRTWATRPAKYETPVQQAPPLSATYVDPPPPPSRIKAHVIESAHKLDQWSQWWWHRRWERLPLRFTVWVIIAVATASLFEIIPTFLIRSNVPTIASVRPYTPLELAGRDVYIAEGCYNCHSQQIRPIISETIRYGEYSKPGEFVFDHPFQWGSRRIGPDLAREGGARSNLWHVEHFKNPQVFNPGSIMPEYAFLLDQPLDFGVISSRVGGMAALGVPYKPEDIETAEQAARAQAEEIAAKIVEEAGGADPRIAVDEQGNEVKPQTALAETRAVALIAYLQRLGKDLTAPPPAPEQPAQAAEVAAAPHEQEATP